MGDLSDKILKPVAASLGLNHLSGPGFPQTEEAENWANEATQDITERFLPRKLNNEEWTPGRIDKLTHLLKNKVKSGPFPNGYCEFTDIGDVSAYLCVLAAYPPSTSPALTSYPLREVSRDEYIDSKRYTISKSRGIYCWDEVSSDYTGLWLWPFGEVVQVQLYYIDKVPQMEYGAAEDFPLGWELIPLVVNYILAQAWKSGERNLRAGKLFQDLYDTQIAMLVGDTQATQSKG